MNPEFVNILCCPKSGERLNLEVGELFHNGSVKTGTLKTETGDRQYPILNGIPRFVDKEAYTQSFGYEWMKWSRVQFESENAARPMAGHTEGMFDAITGFSEQFLRQKLVVEFGCGPGRFLDVARRRGAIAVGIDMSMAVEPARQNFKDDRDVLIVQGDIFSPPFREGSFDAGYSIGVFHHTPDPAKAFEKLCYVVKDNGAIACCVYPKGGLYDSPVVAAYRKIHHAAKPFLGNKPALAYSYFSAYFLYHVLFQMRKTRLGQLLVAGLEKYLLVNVNIPDPKWRTLDVFDAITPLHASTHTGEEVRSWFSRAYCYNVSQMPWGETVWTGIKGSERVRS
jgi:SAM-dependent methyltransferase